MFGLKNIIKTKKVTMIKYPKVINMFTDNSRTRGHSFTNLMTGTLQGLWVSYFIYAAYKGQLGTVPPWLRRRFPSSTTEGPPLSINKTYDNCDIYENTPENK